ncbi:MAG: alpha/beta hydrolase [Nitrospira sp.]|nr:alpha/beta hydrolase [Nitrospira sp.]
MTSSSTDILGYKTYGNGSEKVLLLHHWMGDAASYDPLIPYLNPERYTYAFADVRGYGTSRHLQGVYSVDEVAADAFHLVDSLGWSDFHLIGHSMSGMVVQRMMVDDWISGAKRLKSAIAITPVSADGYPADEGTKKFLWNLIHQRELTEQGLMMLTGQRLSSVWARSRATKHLQTSTKEAVQGYYRMWLETDFSEEVRSAKVGTPVLVIGGRQDLLGFQEEHLRKTVGTWFENTEFTFITDAGHFPMDETPVYLASLMERFLDTHHGVRHDGQAQRHKDPALLSV